MKIGLRQFGDETVHWFRQAAVSGELTRSGLARELCERTDWRTQRGDLCLAQARTVVPQLAARLNIPLPAPVKSVPHPRHHPPCAPMADCACDLEALGVVSVEPVLGTQTRECGGLGLKDSLHWQPPDKISDHIIAEVIAERRHAHGQR